MLWMYSIVAFHRLNACKMREIHIASTTDRRRRYDVQQRCTMYIGISVRHSASNKYVYLLKTKRESDCSDLWILASFLFCDIFFLDFILFRSCVCHGNQFFFYIFDSPSHFFFFFYRFQFKAKLAIMERAERTKCCDSADIEHAL